MMSRPHPRFPHWESREDFAVLCRGVVIKSTRRSRLRLVDENGRAEMTTESRFHYECWHGPVTRGYMARRPQDLARGPAGMTLQRRGTNKGRGCRSRSLLLPFPAHLDKATREVLASRPGISVRKNGAFWEIAEQGQFSLKIHESLVIKYTLDRQSICNVASALSNRLRTKRGRKK